MICSTVPIWKNGAPSSTSGGSPNAGPSCSADLLGPVGDHRLEDLHLQLELVEPVAGRRADGVDLLVDGVGGRRRHRLGVDLAADDLRVDADDVGLLGGQGQDLRPAAADHDRDRRDRLGHGVDLGDR